MTIQNLPESELEIMSILWKRGEPLSAGELTQALSSTRGWKIQTVSTLISRLTAKGYLTSQKRRSASVYLPTISRAEYEAGLAQNLINSAYGGSLKKMFVSLVDGGGITKEELDEIKEWFESRY